MGTEVVEVTKSEINRFADPLYTRAEAARFLGVAEPTFSRWAKETSFVTAIRSPRGSACIPFIGLAEAYTLHAFRSLGVPLQRIRPALERLSREVGLEHALASQQLYTDGAEVLYEYRRDLGDDLVGDLVVVRRQQHVFRDVIADYLQRVDFDHGYAQRLPLIGFKGADLFVDPRRGFGQPVFARGGARLTDALDLFRAGEPLELVAHEFGIPSQQLEAALRASLSAAA
jgi:uncharacterized protein (DUF433 family)